MMSLLLQHLPYVKNKFNRTTGQSSLFTSGLHDVQGHCFARYSYLNLGMVHYVKYISRRIICKAFKWPILSWVEGHPCSKPIDLGAMLSATTSILWHTGLSTKRSLPLIFTPTA